MFDHLEAAGVEYVVAMGNNAVLARHAEPYVAPLRSVVAATHVTATTYDEAAYHVGTWPAPRRTIIKAEVVWHHGRDPRDNPRFVITNLRQTPEWIYTHVYCARGDSENRLKELKLVLAFGRTSCTRFWANQLRVTLTAAAFILFQELQLRADRTALRGAQVLGIRQALITIGVQVVRSVRRIVLHIPRSHPDATTWTRLARARRGARLSQRTRDGHVSSGRRCRRCRAAPTRLQARADPPATPCRPFPPSATGLIPRRRQSEAPTVAETRSLMNNAG